jgi:di/tricarboxylate transporter
MGIPIILAGTLYIIYIGRNSLPTITLDDRIDAMKSIEPDLPAVYRLGERLAMAIIDPESPLCGTALDQSHLRESFHVNLVALKRGEKIISPPSPALSFQPGDTLLLEGRPEDFSEEHLRHILHFISLETDGSLIPYSSAMLLMEAVLAPRSNLIGKSLKDIMFREKYHMNVLAVWRAGKPIRTRFTDQPLQFGDTLLLQGPRDRLRMLRSDPDLIVLADKEADVIEEPSKARLAAIIFLVVLLLGAVGIISIGEVMFAGAIFMVLFGILNIDQAYQAIEWKSIFLVAGMLPMGVALTKTGAATLFADNMFKIIGNAYPITIMAVIFILGVLLTQVISGPAVAAILAPIAIEISTRLGIDPRSFAMGVAIAASMAFITPLGHPVNVLVMGLAGYKFRDFRRIGLPLTLLLFFVVMLLLPVFWPFNKV